MPTTSAFASVLTEAVADFATRGYASDTQLDEWVRRLRQAAQAEMLPDYVVDQQLRESLGTIYQKLVEREGIVARNPGVTRFTLQKVKPKLRDELDRRIMASAQLIRLNREAAIDTTLRRFSGWATSIPVGGSRAVDKVPVKSDVRKAVQQLRFIQRRVAIDQGHKFAANLSDILAVDGGAVAGVWHQHHTRFPRKTHTVRDGRVYALRGNWALEGGLMRAGPAGYADEITRPGEEVSCRCTMQWLYHLRQLPPDMLTAKGRAELARIREIAA